MSAKKATKTTNICASIYEGEFNLDFACVGLDMCKFALCPVMPPTGDDECCYRDHGDCRSPVAKQSALEKLRNRITKELKQYEDEG